MTPEASARFLKAIARGIEGLAGGNSLAPGRHVRLPASRRD